MDGELYRQPVPWQAVQGGSTWRPVEEFVWARTTYLSPLGDFGGEGTGQCGEVQARCSRRMAAKDKWRNRERRVAG